MNCNTKFAVPVSPYRSCRSPTERELFAAKVKLAGVVILLIALLIARVCGSAS